MHLEWRVHRQMELKGINTKAIGFKLGAQSSVSVEIFRSSKVNRFAREFLRIKLTGRVILPWKVLNGSKFISQRIIILKRSPQYFYKCWITHFNKEKRQKIQNYFSFVYLTKNCSFKHIRKLMLIKFILFFFLSSVWISFHKCERCG